MNPGTPEAIGEGCKCPEKQPETEGETLRFLIQEDCPLHGRGTWREPAKT